MGYFYFSFLCICIFCILFYDECRLFLYDKETDSLLGKGLTNVMKVKLVEVQRGHEVRETSSTWYKGQQYKGICCHL